VLALQFLETHDVSASSEIQVGRADLVFLARNDNLNISIRTLQITELQ